MNYRRSSYLIVLPFILAVMLIGAWLPLPQTTTTYARQSRVSAMQTASPWTAYTYYPIGALVTYGGKTYKCIQAHTAYPGWEPPRTPALWQEVTGPVPTATATRPPATATATRPPATTTRTPTRVPGTPIATATSFPSTATPTRVPITPTPTGTPSCAVQGAPSGKVLVGYWESWDGSGVHPGMGHIPLSQSHVNYNVLDLAFPVLRSDGTAVWEDGMDVGVDVPTPAEICAEKAKGRRVLLSIGGAAAGMDLNSRAVAQRFIDTIVPILKTNNFDGIDIDIETGLVAGGSWSQNSSSQNNLIYIIDSILAQMPANFMLTMAPETAYVTGGQIAYGGPWGAYLPIIKRYLDNGRLNWLQMQYYNGNMYGCPPPGATYQAGTVQGFVEQTRCMMYGFQVAGGGPTITIPASKIVVGLPAQPGAGGGYMSPSLVRTAYGQVSSIRGLMTWSINWDGSKGWTFATNKPF